MANALYDKGRQAFLGGSISWSGDTIKCVLASTATYTVNLATHQYYSDLTGVVGSPSTAFGGKTVTDGIADANDVTFTAVSGSAVGAIIIYKDTGVGSTSPLIAYIDSAASGLPVTPNGGDITVSWSNGTNKIFKL